MTFILQNSMQNQPHDFNINSIEISRIVAVLRLQTNVRVIDASWIVISNLACYTIHKFDTSSQVLSLDKEYACCNLVWNYEMS